MAPALHFRLVDADNQRLLDEFGRHHTRGNLLRFLDDPRVEHWRSFLSYLSYLFVGPRLLPFPPLLTDATHKPRSQDLAFWNQVVKIT